MHNQGCLTFLGENFAPEEVQRIVAFLDRGFSPDGEATVATNIFFYAKEHGKKLADVFAACELEWTRNWQNQQLNVRGDTDAPGPAGVQNRISLSNIYKALGIQNQSREGKNIPKEPMIVKTGNSTYIIGPANENGERTMSKEGEALPFQKCRIISLAKGEVMKYSVLDGLSSNELWETSQVDKITIFIKAGVPAPAIQLKLANAS